MAKHVVKCAVCGESFDLNSIQGVRATKTRYAHQKCFPKGELVPMVGSTVKNPDEKALNDYISKLYGKKANWVLIKKQIKEYLGMGYSLKGIKTTLIYFYEVKGNDVEKSNGGIGIVPYIYQEAYDYYYNIWETQQRAAQGVEKLANSSSKEVTIKAPQPQRPPHKLFKSIESEEGIEIKEDGTKIYTTILPSKVDNVKIVFKGQIKGDTNEE